MPVSSGAPPPTRSAGPAPTRDVQQCEEVVDALRRVHDEPHVEGKEGAQHGLQQEAVEDAHAEATKALAHSYGQVDVLRPGEWGGGGREGRRGKREWEESMVGTKGGGELSKELRGKGEQSDRTLEHL